MGANKASPGDKEEVEVGVEEDKEVSCRLSLVVRVDLKWVLKQDRSQARREKGVVEVKWGARTRAT